jgi:hypothetical protein
MTPDFGGAHFGRFNGYFAPLSSRRTHPLLISAHLCPPHLSIAALRRHFPSAPQLGCRVFSLPALLACNTLPSPLPCFHLDPPRWDILLRASTKEGIPPRIQLPKTSHSIPPSPRHRSTTGDGSTPASLLMPTLLYPDISAGATNSRTGRQVHPVGGNVSLLVLALRCLVTFQPPL